MIPQTTSSGNDTTVIVLGAGASKPYGLPLGRELRDLVLRIRDDDRSAKLLRRFGVSTNEFREFRSDLQMSAISTVDAFLEQRPKWMKVGKIAMALALDGKENEEELFPPNHPRDHWYESLWQALNCSSWPSLKRKQIRVISFNYDRTLECYLCGVIANNYRITRAKASDWLREDFIVHPHGTLGDYKGERLHWLSSDRSDEYRRVKQAVDNIVVISEANPKTKAFIVARKILEESHNYIFLGFGFHRQNMRRLGFPYICSHSPRAVYASHKGIPNNEWRLISRQLLNRNFPDMQSWPSLSRLVSQCIK